MTFRATLSTTQTLLENLEKFFPSSKPPGPTKEEAYERKVPLLSYVPPFTLLLRSNKGSNTPQQTNKSTLQTLLEDLFANFVLIIQHINGEPVAEMAMITGWTHELTDRHSRDFDMVS